MSVKGTSSKNSEVNTEDWLKNVEPPNHTYLKNKFMEAHSGKYPKDRLLCLSHTFGNMEFLGSRYLPEVESLVHSLAEEVPEIVEYRNSKKNSLKRTFVSASDATRAKNQRKDSDVPTKKPKLIFVAETKHDETPASNNKPTDERIRSQYDDTKDSRKQIKKETNRGVHKNNKATEDINFTLSPEDQMLLHKVRNQTGGLEKIVLMIANESVNPYGVVCQAAEKSGLFLSTKKTGKVNGSLFEYKMQLGDSISCTDYAMNDKTAHSIVGQKMLVQLQETCFTIMSKSQVSGMNINKKDTMDIPPPEDKPDEDLLPSDNKGTLIMKLMGWKGQGLGKNADGRQKPVEVTRTVNRIGLDLIGTADLHVLQRKVREHLRNFIRDPEIYNLVFSSDFTNEERKAIHEVAQQLKLKSKSYGKKSRQLVVSKKMEPWQMVEFLLSKGGETPTHMLIRPTKIKI